MSESPRFILVVSNPVHEHDNAALQILNSAPEHLRRIVNVQYAEGGEATPILHDTKANATCSPQQTLAILTNLVQSITQSRPGGGVGGGGGYDPDAQARARAALLQKQRPPVVPPAAAAYPTHMPTQTPMAARAAPQLPYQDHTALPSSGYTRPSMPAVSAPAPSPAAPIQLDDLASPTGGFGIPGGYTNFTRAIGGPSVGSGFRQPGDPKDACISITEDQSVHLLDRMFDSTGYNPPVSGGMKQPGPGSVSVESLIPQISEKTRFDDKLPDGDELEARRQREDEQIQARRVRASAATGMPVGTGGGGGGMGGMGMGGGGMGGAGGGMGGMSMGGAGGGMGGMGMGGAGGGGMGGMGGGGGGGSGIGMGGRFF